MALRCHKLAFPITALVVGLVLGTGSICPAAEFSLIDRGWRIVKHEGQHEVQLHALVVNESKRPLDYEVRFIVECAERPAGTERAARPNRGKGQPVGTLWFAVKTIRVGGGPLAPGASDPVRTAIPYDFLERGKLYRYRAELHDASTGALLARAAITRLNLPFLVAAGLTRAAVLASARGAAEALTEEPESGSGSGIMEGTHESRRMGNEWVERGSGTINLAGSLARMVLSYTYDARGPSAGSLAATATATGTLVPRSGRPLPVRITSASAQMTVPGARQQAGQVISRSGARATGTFSGVVGAKPWTGLLTMTEGVMTLDLVSNTGTHRFKIQFTAAP